MADRYDLLTVREYERNGEKKTSFTKIGVMFPNRNGDGFTISLDALPIPTSDGCRILAKPPQERENSGQRREAPPARQNASQSRDDDDWPPL